ncbi:MULTISPECIES: hypothetical protein [Streptomyces]|uniref:hypothetical protein n=1 Tax=Streptomyces TaxID=1883 RepID=UPI0004CDC422|nr:MULTISPECIES: hypothetical protein [Streptomyces]KOT47259.1 hypothetical protein ADK43_39870 [Streptomyces rimosus subsp. rimosus]
MTTKKPAKPWLVRYTTPGGPIEQKYRSEPETYRAISKERDRIADGSSRVQRIRVEKWSADTGRWEYFKTAYPEK